MTDVLVNIKGLYYSYLFCLEIWASFKYTLSSITSCSVYLSETKNPNFPFNYCFGNMTWVQKILYSVEIIKYVISFFKIIRYWLDPLTIKGVSSDFNFISIYMYLKNNTFKMFLIWLTNIAFGMWTVFSTAKKNEKVVIFGHLSAEKSRKTPH